jgi:hypothetical protein
MGVAFPAHLTVQLETPLLQVTWQTPSHVTVQADRLEHVMLLLVPTTIAHVDALAHVALQDSPQMNSQFVTLSHASVHPSPHEAVQLVTPEQLELQPLLQTNPQVSAELQVCVHPSPLHPR